ncbi:MAG: hypothetical protein V2A61_03600 [Calditrichota bacterium]
MRRAKGGVDSSAITPLIPLKAGTETRPTIQLYHQHQHCSPHPSSLIPHPSSLIPPKPSGAPLKAGFSNQGGVVDVSRRRRWVWNSH